MPFTPSQNTNQNNQVYKDAQNNVFEVGTNNPITLDVFKQRGLNIDHINTLADIQANTQQPAQQPPIGTLPSTGTPPPISTTPTAPPVQQPAQPSGNQSFHDFKKQNPSGIYTDRNAFFDALDKATGQKYDRNNDVIFKTFVDSVLYQELMLV